MVFENVFEAGRHTVGKREGRRRGRLTQLKDEGIQLNHFSEGNVGETRRFIGIQTLAENTGWSHVEGQLDKKRMAFSQRLTKKLEEPKLR